MLCIPRLPPHRGVVLEVGGSRLLAAACCCWRLSLHPRPRHRTVTAQKAKGQPHRHSSQPLAVAAHTKRAQVAVRSTNTHGALASRSEPVCARARVLVPPNIHTHTPPAPSLYINLAPPTSRRSTSHLLHCARDTFCTHRTHSPASQSTRAEGGG